MTDQSNDMNAAPSKIGISMVGSRTILSPKTSLTFKNCEELEAVFNGSVKQHNNEVILDCKMDNRNFRKKILKTKYLVQLDEKQKGVAHKPAYYYRFDRDIYETSKRENLGFNF